MWAETKKREICPLCNKDVCPTKTTPINDIPETNDEALSETIRLSRKS